MSERELPINIESTLAAAAHAFIRINQTADAELLASANVELRESGFDNWDGGTITWELKLEVPFPDYLALGQEHREEIEKFIDDVVSPFLPESGHWVKTAIKPSEFNDPNWRHKVATQALPLDKYQTITESDSRLVFISYQTANKNVAGKLQGIFQEVGVSSFLAHEDIEVSAEWRERILEELGKATIIISLLSEEYFRSEWCVQESGIAAYRGIISLHLSIDGNIPRGFSSIIQSVRIDPENITLVEILPGIVASDFDLGIQLILDTIGRSRSYRGAEANFRLIIPYISRMSDQQKKELLEKAHSNGQIHHAGQCAKEYLPPLLQSWGHLISGEKLDYLQATCEEYA